MINLILSNVFYQAFVKLLPLIFLALVGALVYVMYFLGNVPSPEQQTIIWLLIIIPIWIAIQNWFTRRELKKKAKQIQKANNMQTAQNLKNMENKK